MVKSAMALLAGLLFGLGLIFFGITRQHDSRRPPPDLEYRRQFPAIRLEPMVSFMIFMQQVERRCCACKYE